MLCILHGSCLPIFVKVHPKNFITRSKAFLFHEAVTGMPHSPLFSQDPDLIFSVQQRTEYLSYKVEGGGGPEMGEINSIQILNDKQDSFFFL